MSRVKKILGIPENELVKLENNEHLIVRYSKMFINCENYETTNYGYFETKSIKELRELVEENSQQIQNTVPFEILQGLDIGDYKVERNSLVQVASNFNCLELPNRKSNPFSGYLVEDAHLDYTQGPAACFGPLSGYLYRTHFIPP